jgi:hypothetical protein
VQTTPEHCGSRFFFFFFFGLSKSKTSLTLLPILRLFHLLLLPFLGAVSPSTSLK